MLVFPSITQASGKDTIEYSKFIIMYVSREMGVDEHLMLAIADAESDFIADADNPKSTAGGLFQILDGTWEWFECEGEKTNPIDNTLCAIKIATTSGIHHWNASKWSDDGWGWEYGHLAYAPLTSSMDRM